MMKAYEVLQKAASYIAEHGWTQGHSVDSRGRVCLEGAILRVSRMQSPCMFANRWVLPVIEEQYPGELWTDAHHWNDAYSRTQDEVITILEKAAVRASEQEVLADLDS